MLIRILAVLATVLAVVVSVMPLARAEETTINKVKDTVDDTKLKAKKMARAEKRKAREAIGNDKLGKDIKD